MVCLEKAISPKKRTLSSDLALFLLQSSDTFKTGDSQSGQLVMGMMHKSICSHYGLSEKDFNILLTGYVSNLYRSSNSVGKLRYFN